MGCRKECKDFVSVFAQLNAPWTEVASFFTRHTIDLSQVIISPDSSSIIAVDSPLQFKVVVFSISGEELAVIEPPSLSLGVKMASFSSCGSFLSLGTYDSHIMLVSPLSWGTAVTYPHIHPKNLHACFKAPLGGETFVPMFVEDEEVEIVKKKLSPIPTNSTNSDDLKSVQRSGIGLVAWSYDGTYLVLFIFMFF